MGLKTSNMDLRKRVRLAAESFYQHVKQAAEGGKALYMITLYGTSADSKKLESGVKSKFSRDLDGEIETKFRSGGAVVSFRLNSPADKKVISLAKQHDASEVKLNLGSKGTKSIWKD